MTKEQFCKCGHAKHDHKKYLDRPCNFCPCSEWMKSGRPNMEDKILTGIIIGFTGFGLIIAIVFTMIFYEGTLLTEENNVPFEITLREFSAIVFVIGILVIMFLINWIVDSVLGYINLKRRRDYNAQNSNTK